jgi:hypothetical protein
MTTMLTETGPPVELRVLLFKEDSLWIAQCIDYDIVAQADRLADVKYEFERMFVTYVAAAIENGLVPFADLPRAPDRYVAMFEEAVGNRLEGEWPEFSLPPGMPASYNLPRRPSAVRIAS